MLFRKTTFGLLALLFSVACSKSDQSAVPTSTPDNRPHFSTCSEPLKLKATLVGPQEPTINQNVLIKVEASGCTGTYQTYSFYGNGAESIATYGSAPVEGAAVRGMSIQEPNEFSDRSPQYLVKKYSRAARITESIEIWDNAYKGTVTAKVVFWVKGDGTIEDTTPLTQSPYLGCTLYTSAKAVFIDQNFAGPQFALAVKIQEFAHDVYLGGPVKVLRVLDLSKPDGILFYEEYPKNIVDFELFRIALKTPGDHILRVDVTNGQNCYATCFTTVKAMIPAEVGF